jgi:cyclase
MTHPVPGGPPHGTPKVVGISDGVYAYLQPDGSWYLNNTGFLVGRRGVISIDACATQRRTRAYLDAVSAVTPQPVRTLVNTHHHGDHTYGNYLMRGATIVGHERCREEALALGLLGNTGIWSDVEWGDLELAPPFLTYDTGITLWSDELRCDVRYVGTPAHTTNDSIIYIPDHSVLFAGDLLFSGGTPFALMGSVSGWIEVLEHVVRPLGAQTIIPGHGPVGGPEMIDEVLGYLRFVQDIARQAKAAGLAPLDAARQADLGAYAGLLDAERIVGNLHRAYAELGDGDSAPPGLGAPLDIITALTEMVAYNGGRPLTCHA